MCVTTGVWYPQSVIRNGKKEFNLKNVSVFVCKMFGVQKYCISQDAF